MIGASNHPASIARLLGRPAGAAVARAKGWRPIEALRSQWAVQAQERREGGAAFVLMALMAVAHKSPRLPIKDGLGNREAR
jgi:hypothetical protein